MHIFCLVLCIIYALHICAEALTGGFFGEFLFYEALYLPVIALFCGILCWNTAKNMVGKKKLCQNIGAAVLVTLSVVSALFGFLKIGCHHGDDCSPCHYSISLAVGYAIPFLTAAGIYQYIQKWKQADHNYQRSAAVFSIAILTVFAVRTAWFVIGDIIDQPEVISIETLSILDIFYIPFVPILLAGNGIIRFIQTAQDITHAPKQNSL